MDRYLARIPWETAVTELGETAPFPPKPPRTLRVVLDERGRALGSEDFAALLGRWRDEGVREAQFLIGGANGHEAETRATADLLLSLGPATFPHMLVRAMIGEQLYRGFSILSGHPYHRGDS